MVRMASTALAVGILALCGCGGGGAEGPREVPASLASFCDHYAEVTCGWGARCAPDQVIGPASECVQPGATLCKARFEPLVAAYRARRLDWNASAASACLAEYTGACGDQASDCYALFRPAVEPGGACDVAPPWSASGIWIDGEECKEVACPRACGATCPQRAPVGGYCQYGEDCAVGSFCNGWNGVCTAVRALSESCVSFEQCVQGAYCADPATRLRCTESDPSLSTCRCAPKLPDGGQCGADSVYPYNPCQSGACLGGTCVSFTEGRCNLLFPCSPGQFCDGLPPVSNIFDQGTCAPLRGAGGACTYASDCQAGLVCHTDGTCGPPGDIGAACQPAGAGRVDCAEGLGCDGGSCAARPTALGADCSAAMPCFGAGLTCDPDMQRCVSAAIPCTSVDPCPTDAACEGGVCVRYAGVGASCDPRFPRACASGICVGTPPFGTCRASLCAE